MRKTVLLLSVALAIVLTGGLLLTMAPTSSAAGIHGGIVFMGPGPFFGPYYPYGFYPYAPYYVAANYRTPRSLRCVPETTRSSCAALTVQWSIRKRSR